MHSKLSAMGLKSGRARTVGATLVASLLGFAVCARLATAEVPHTFEPGQTLTAADLNENFNDLDTRVSQVEAVPTSLTVTGTAAQNGTVAYAPTVYTHADLVLPPGTWLVQGYAGLTLALNDDGVGLGLFNVTANANVPNSVGPIQTLRASDPYQVGLSTAQTLITVSAPTTLRLKAIQNGNSIPTFFDFDNPLVAPLAALGPHKLTAIKLR